MADWGHSVFAPYRNGRANAAVPLNAIAVQPNDAVRDHRREFALSSLPPTLVRRGQPAVQEDASTRRTKIWEFSTNLHCSIIGTCLSTGELRQTLSRLGLVHGDWTDHDLHHTAVSLAARHDQSAKQLHKALDRRHKLAISQFGKARTEAELTTLWRDAAKRGDIPGAYWAVLTHPATTPALVRTVFGEVHMLSHLVGAANRADIRRLSELEQRNTELEAKLRRQQEALRQAVVTRDATIHDLREALRQRLTEGDPVVNDGTTALRDLIAELEKRLSVEARRRVAVETRLHESRDALSHERQTRQALQSNVAALHAELSVIETILRPTDDAAPSRIDGLSLLYVGGRPNQMTHLRALAENLGGTLLHHDGGIEHNPDLLPGLTSRADVVMFPVDCVSHEAALMVKRLCRQADKKFIPLRSASATAFLAALRPAATRSRF